MALSLKCGLINIDNNNKIITISGEYEDEDTGEIVSDTITINYYIIMENNEIVNKILYQPNGDDYLILPQNNNGFAHDLDGIYLNETGNRRYTFNSANGTVVEEYYTNDTWRAESQFNGEYGSFNEIYFFIEPGSAYITFNVSADKNTITYQDENWVKTIN